MFKRFLIFYFMLFSETLLSAQLSDIGPHLKVFEFEKTENPKNILLVFTRADRECRFLPDERDKTKPVFDFYWMMNRTTYKPTHSLIKRGIYKHILMDSGSTEKTYSLKLKDGDIERFDTDLKNPRLVVVLRKTPSCEAVALLKLGPSDKEKTIRIQTIHAESVGSFMPPFRKIISVTFKGVDDSAGTPIAKTYLAKK